MYFQPVISRSAERRDQRRVDIDNPVFIFTDQLRRDHHKESGKHDQIRLERIHRLHEGMVKPGTVLKVFRGNTFCRNPCLLSPRQGICLFIVADHTGHFGVCDLSIPHRIQNCLKIRTAAGYQDYHS